MRKTPRTDAVWERFRTDTTGELEPDVEFSTLARDLEDELNNALEKIKSQIIMNTKTKYLVKDLDSGLEFYHNNASRPTLEIEVLENKDRTKTMTKNLKWNHIEYEYAVIKNSITYIQN